MSCKTCLKYIPLDPPIRRIDSHGQAYEIEGLCKDGADKIICGLPVYKPTASCDKMIEAPQKCGN